MVPTISLINQSSSLAQTDVERVSAALQRQLHEHFAPAWGRDATLQTVDPMGTPEPGTWWLCLLDDPAQGDVLGRHDLTSEGLPLGKVFLSIAGDRWSETASHELLEMLVDPELSLSVFLEPPGKPSLFYALEICDPCQGAPHSYPIGDVVVSDFVLPTWFQSFAANTPFDHAGLIHAPFSLGEGGYIGVFDPAAAARRWQQLTATGEIVDSATHAHGGSRRARRDVPHERRRRSRESSQTQNPTRSSK